MFLKNIILFINPVILAIPVIPEMGIRDLVVHDCNAGLHILSFDLHILLFIVYVNIYLVYIYKHII